MSLARYQKKNLDREIETFFGQTLQNCTERYQKKNLDREIETPPTWMLRARCSSYQKKNLDREIETATTGGDHDHLEGKTKHKVVAGSGTKNNEVKSAA